MSQQSIYVSNCINNSQMQYQPITAGSSPMIEAPQPMNITMNNGIPCYFPQSGQPIAVPAQMVPPNQSQRFMILDPRCCQAGPGMFQMPLAPEVPPQIIVAQQPGTNQYTPCDFAYEFTRGMSKIREYFKDYHNNLVNSGQIPPNFNPQDYLRANPDLVKFCAEKNQQCAENKRWLAEFAYRHYITKGRYENRPIKPPTQVIPIAAGAGQMMTEGTPMYTSVAVMGYPQAMPQAIFVDNSQLQGQLQASKPFFIQAPVAQLMVTDQYQNKQLHHNPNKESGTCKISMTTPCSSITQVQDAGFYLNNNENSKSQMQYNNQQYNMAYTREETQNPNEYSRSCVGKKDLRSSGKRYKKIKNNGTDECAVM